MLVNATTPQFKGKVTETVHKQPVTFGFILGLGGGMSPEFDLNEGSDILTLRKININGEGHQPYFFNSDLESVEKQIKNALEKGVSNISSQDMKNSLSKLFQKIENARDNVDEEISKATLFLDKVSSQKRNRINELFSKMAQLDKNIKQVEAKENRLKEIEEAADNNLPGKRFSKQA